MLLNIEQSEVNQTTSVLELRGRIVYGGESELLLQTISELTRPEKKNLVLDLKNLTYVDGAGMGTLVACFHSARQKGCRIVLCNVGQGFQEALRVTRLSRVFEIFETRDAALQAFNSSS